MDYEVKLDIFEGPLDLLLHLIHKNEVDIFDIPIATITDQYLAYLDMMKALNINIAGDFLIMSSTLIHIKSKMLLPKSDDEDEEDPRLEITRPLLEYMKFKELAGDLSERELLERDVFARQIQSDMREQVSNYEPQLELNLFELMDAFKKIMDKKLPGVQMTFKIATWSVKEKMEVIINRLKENVDMFFDDIFDDDFTVSELVVTFLALLELVHLGIVRIMQPLEESQIRLIPYFDEDGEE